MNGLRKVKQSKTIPFQKLKTLAENYSIKIKPPEGFHYKFCHPELINYSKSKLNENIGSSQITIPVKNDKDVKGHYVQKVIKFTDYLNEEQND